ncbi:MAG: tetratricopeptide repeat protein [Gammaproteobacteria bacterium]
MCRLALIAAMFAAALMAAGSARAVEPVQSATVMGPSNPQLSDGATALDAGNAEEGIRLTLDGLKTPTEPHDKAAGYSNLCAGYAMLKQWDEALESCNTSIALDKNNWRTFNNRAAAHAGKGQYELAVADIRAGLDIAPNSRTLLETLRIVQQNKRLYGTRSRSSIRSP